MADQLLAAAEQDAPLEGARAGPPLHALDERAVLASNLAVEGEQVVDPLALDVRAEEVEEAVRPLRPARNDRADRDVRTAGQDVHGQVRPEEVELAARQLAREVERRRAS